MSATISIPSRNGWLRGLFGGQPHQLIGAAGRPYLLRWFLIPPKGVVLPELVQWLPRVALDEPIGNIGDAALAETTSTVTALVS